MIAARRGALSTETKRQGWALPTEGARLARSSSLSIRAGGSGSVRKRRTSLRQAKSSASRAWKAASKTGGDGARLMQDLSPIRAADALASATSKRQEERLGSLTQSSSRNPSTRKGGIVAMPARWLSKAVVAMASAQGPKKAVALPARA